MGQGSVEAPGCQRSAHCTAQDPVHGGILDGIEGQLTVGLAAFWVNVSIQAWSLPSAKQNDDSFHVA